MSAELVEAVTALSHPQWSVEVEEPADDGDSNAAVYSESGSCSECGTTGVETYLGRCEEHVPLVQSETGDLLQPADFNWTDHCQADACGGRVQYTNGLGTCDTCGIPHRKISAENYRKLFARP
jgi:hypothetical protein